MILRKIFATRSLELTYTATTAREFFEMEAKTYRHSEYDTDWSDTLNKWMGEKYFRFVKEDTFKGTDDVIFRITFMEISSDTVNEFIKELSEYMRPLRSSFEHVKWGIPEDINNQ